MTVQQRRGPRDSDEAAAFKGLGQAIIANRDRQGVDRQELASRCEMTPAELEAIERGEIDEFWGGIRLIAKAFDMRLGALAVEAEGLAPGPG
jgi:transcriptional regulator with XRE-family HTH domain